MPGQDGARASWRNIGDNGAAVAARASLETTPTTVVPSTIRTGVPTDSLAIGRIGELGENALRAGLVRDEFVSQARLTVTLDDGSTFVVIPDFLERAGTAANGRVQLVYRESKASTIATPSIEQLTDNQARFVDAILNGRIQSIQTSNSDLISLAGGTDNFDVIGFELNVFDVIE